jgi:FkbM family methyltransferase
MQSNDMPQKLTIAILAPGAMGAGVGARLTQNDAHVLVPLAGRSKASRERARIAGMHDATDADIAGADFILSIVPPAEAMAFALRLQAPLRAAARKATYIDCNAVAPQTAREIAAVIAGADAVFLDSGIIGGPPQQGEAGPRFYISGPEAERARVLADYGLDIRVMEGALGDASALKMCYGGLNKGQIALATMAARAAIDAGIGRAFIAELGESQPAMLRSLQRGVPSMLPKAYRWVAEMEEVAQFYERDAERQTYLGIAAMYARVADAVARDSGETKALRGFFKRAAEPPRAADVAYGQRFEDRHLMRAFANQTTGFYIDVGAGHPVVDNVSFAFYLKGWRGITVEPNPKLARLSRAVRGRDFVRECVAGASEGEATFYRVEEFHGFSTTLKDHATAVLETFGNTSVASTVPMTTLATLCAEHAPAEIDFLKVDVEGAEESVLAGNDWTKYRPKIVLCEALAPVTQEPSWEAWEPILTRNGYRFAFFDSLNRYYVADEAAHLIPLLQAAPENFDGITQIGMFGGAESDAKHPDHALARQLSAGAMTAAPFIAPQEAAAWLSQGLTPEQLLAPANKTELDRLCEVLFGQTDPALAEEFSRAGIKTVGDLYAWIVQTDAFRVACGRISASYAW